MNSNHDGPAGEGDAAYLNATPLNATPLNVVVHNGDGPHALLVHGALGSRSLWAENLAALQQVCRPVVVELWGHGRSPSPTDPAHYKSAGYVAEFEQLRSRLGIDRWHTIGQSMGAGLTLTYGLAHPERVISQVVTNSTSAFAPIDGWREHHASGATPMAERLRTEGTEFLRNAKLNPGRSRHLAETTRQLLAIEFDEHDATGIANSMTITTATLPLGERLTKVTRPTLLTLGVEEERFLRLVPRARLIPNLEVVELAASHGVNTHDADGWNEAVAAFLTRHHE